MEAWHTISDVIRYIYGEKNFARIDAFNKANQEIIEYLKTNIRTPADINPVDAWTFNGKPLFKDPTKHNWKARKYNRDGMNPLLYKAFDYIVNRKLDYSEIMNIDNDFKSALDIKNVFHRLQRSNSLKIDSIYKKHQLDLPSFSTWKASDFNKGPSDRGQLKPEQPEYGPEQSKINYDQYGNKTLTQMEEQAFRKYIRNILEETYFSSLDDKNGD